MLNFHWNKSTVKKGVEICFLKGTTQRRKKRNENSTFTDMEHNDTLDADILLDITDISDLKKNVIKSTITWQTLEYIFKKNPDSSF